jgi:hypothetical protein
LLRSYRARFLLVHIGDPSSNQVTSLESQVIHMIQGLFGQTLRVSIYNLPKCVLPTSVWPHAVQSISDWKNHFVEECDRCDEKNNCSGFFTTGRPRYSRGIHAIASERGLTGIAPSGAGT